jgi:hypothetical protein
MFEMPQEMSWEIEQFVAPVRRTGAAHAPNHLRA